MQACDGFTKNFLRKLGVKVPSFEPPPADPYTQHREKVLIIHLNIVILCTIARFLELCAGGMD